jgi:phosphate transport system permease protein
VADTTRILKPGEPLPADRPVSLFRERTSRRQLVDRLGRRLVTLGGVAIIGSILAILVVIVIEVYPLFKAPTAARVGTVSSGAALAPIEVGVDEYREVAYLIHPRGVQFISLKGGTTYPASVLPGLESAQVVTASPPSREGAIALGLSDGRVIPIEVKFSVSHAGGKRTIEPDLVAGRRSRSTGKAGRSGNSPTSREGAGSQWRRSARGTWSW